MRLMEKEEGVWEEKFVKGFIKEEVRLHFV